MRLAFVGLGLLLLGAVALATGVLPPADAAAIGARVWPILLFAVAVTVVAELADAAGVFAAVAERLARLARGHGWLLWMLVVLLAVAATVFLSLDTTAVLLTPVVVLLARHHGYPPLPFALTTVWLANTGSLLLPVSNLTNLLAEHALGFSDPGRFAALMALPALVAIVVPCLVIAIVFRRVLGTRYEPVAAEDPHDRVLFWVAAGVLAVLIPALVSGVPVWIPATAAALVLVAAFAWRDRRRLRPGLVPWGLLLFASGLFLVVGSAHALGLTELLGAVTGTGDSVGALLRMSASGAVGANLVNNLPAYLALEPLADSPARVAALLVGVNAGPLVTPWASLAVLLWHDRLRALDVDLSWRRYLLLGLVAAPLTVVLATLTLPLALVA
ncbi:SLC13 family permease [Protaetiibacter intestinalis]|uniref:Arsenic transporter n=1 Tax=Protaetiibacter intestinalis TaxID=2419774 RepID=A0A387B4Y2_9MICO|nr:SLC13 family permease [Protaetiibacter intestinalis]AYF97367.1 arsenic transporter [Protaetiibacter intestinalis]